MIYMYNSLDLYIYIYIYIYLPRYGNIVQYMHTFQPNVQVAHSLVILQP